LLHAYRIKLRNEAEHLLDIQDFEELFHLLFVEDPWFRTIDETAPESHLT
jgi:hypothetical protein